MNTNERQAKYRAIHLAENAIEFRANLQKKKKEYLNREENKEKFKELNRIDVQNHRIKKLNLTINDDGIAEINRIQDERRKADPEGYKKVDEFRKYWNENWMNKIKSY